MKEAKAIKVVCVCVCVLGERGKDESNWRLPWNAVQLHIPHNPCVIAEQPWCAPCLIILLQHSPDDL